MTVEFVGLTPEQRAAFATAAGFTVRTSRTSHAALVEALAHDLHEAGRAAVERGLVVNNLGKPFMGWDAISEPAREGMRVQARYVLDRYDLMPKA